MAEQMTGLQYELQLFACRPFPINACHLQNLSGARVDGSDHDGGGENSFTRIPPYSRFFRFALPAPEHEAN